MSKDTANDTEQPSESEVASSDWFCIRPWKWEQTADNDYCKSWEPEENWGSYRVELLEGGDEYTASYCYDEYYDEHDVNFDTLEEAKGWCWREWIARITPHLIPQNAEDRHGVKAKP